MLELASKTPPELAGAPAGILRVLDSSEPIDLSYATMPSHGYYIGEFKGRVNTPYGRTEFQVQALRPAGLLGIMQDLLALDPVRAGKLTVHHAEPPTARVLDKEEADALLAACQRRKSTHLHTISRAVLAYRDQLLSAAPAPELLDPSLWLRRAAAPHEFEDYSRPNGDDFVRSDGLDGLLTVRLINRKSSLAAQLLAESKDGAYLELHYRDQLLDYKELFEGRCFPRIEWLYRHLSS
ncbi:MAG: hypothetical protein K1X83_06895 [Oligoflexia bacterium]|nr:hypothetical protein [Oligoflexia bacterium]